MICRRLHDDLDAAFGDVDSAGYHAAVKAAFRHEHWSSLLGVSAERDQALLHASDCPDCLDDLLMYLEIRDHTDYREFPCLHLAYYATKEELCCVENDRGFFFIMLPGRKSEGIGIGFCPWCGIALPTTSVEMDEARELGFRAWQERQKRPDLQPRRTREPSKGAAARSSTEGRPAA